MKEEFLKLQPGETMHDVRVNERLDRDCANIVRAVERNPGIPSKDAIADETGLKSSRVARCIKEINSNQTPFQRIDYGLKLAKAGPYAGEVVRGWWPQRKAVYQEVMVQADDHSSSVERGIRRSRLHRLAFAHGLTTKQGAKVVASIEAQLGLDVEEMSEADFGAVQELVLERVT